MEQIFWIDDVIENRGSRDWYVPFFIAYDESPAADASSAIAWLRNCARQQHKELGYSHELWTYQLLTAHIRPGIALQSGIRYWIDFGLLPWVLPGPECYVLRDLGMALSRWEAGHPFDPVAQPLCVGV